MNVNYVERVNEGKQKRKEEELSLYINNPLEHVHSTIHTHSGRISYVPHNTVRDC